MRESASREFKREVSRSFLKTVSAFANFGEGRILFGVADDGTVIGIPDASEACLRIENAIDDSLSPRPRYTLNILDRKAGNVIELHVLEGKDKPYLYKGKAYRRSDTSSVEVDSSELRRLVLEGQNLSFEEAKCTDQDLSFDTLSEQMRTRAGVDSTDKNVLRTLRLLTAESDYNNAAAILSDQNGFAGIDIIRFGKSINDILDRERHEGISALAQLERSMEMFGRYYAYEKVIGVRRELIERIPQRAFREAVANALVHRLWDEPANIQISMEESKVTISSPGGLPRGISFEEYLTERVSVLRNPIIANVFYRLDYVEMFGTGVARIKKAYDGCDAAPSFRATENFIIVELPVIDAVPNTTTADERKLLHAMAPNQLLSRKELETALGFGQAKTGRLLKSLEDKGKVNRTGTGRATRYQRI